ncbi:ABC transporter substrate-binding protein [Prauserella marina]|uniref:Polar amino acid transport system substrate-binding protein n=1 Tax=Prauserella marina TaxID=530584 RepID=A0A222VX73_9PSEU|nr:glutamate ABC transporter substrate-binding protein [Prauserella marina]ASR38525.1 ABC transporter substrate-binding protein [Prauserella marina]PWV81830.1 amino acid ABC transporter substrate-binding protein (PAAT family) [Prauserella marina]SDD13314.1 polar amino acid transport system substrate-binding protein [Prauserella marina]
MNRKTRWTVLLAATAALVAGCGSPGAPVDPAPVESVQRPMPPNAAEEHDVDGGGSTNDGCNPAASLGPSGNVPSGSTMDEIRQRGYLIVGVDQNTFLFGFRNPTTGKLEGFDIDIAKQVAKELLGDPEAVQFKAISSAQRIPTLTEGQVDIVVRTFSITCERLEDINFSTVYYVAGQRVLVNKDSDVEGVGDLGGKRVCASKTSTSLPNVVQAAPEALPISVDDWSDCLVMLQQGQVEAVSTDDTILAGMAEQDPTTKIVGDRFTDELYGIGIPKENTDMVRYVNYVLDKVRGGPWQDSYRTWLLDRLGSASPPRPEYQ